MKSRNSFVPRLVVIEGNDKGKVIPLKDGTLVIGRSKGDILIHDPRISRSHVALHFDEKKGRLSFTDLKSLNGVLHNGASQETGDLLDGDKLQLGNTTFDCQIAREGNDATVNATHPSRVLPQEKKATKKPSKSEDDLELVPLLDNKDELLVKEQPPKSEVGLQTAKWRAIPKRTKLIAGTGLVVLVAIAFQSVKKSVGDLTTELTAARTLASQGKVEEAVSKAETLSKQFSQTSESFMLLGDLYAQQGKYEQSLSNYRKAHDLPPEQPMVHLRLIRIFLRAGLNKEAEGELKHVDEIIRKEGAPSKDLFIETAEIFLEFKELKQPAEKLYILAKALQNAVAPGNKIGYKLEVQSYLIQSRTQEAVAVLNTLAKMDPKDEWTYENLAFAKLSLSDVSGAVEAVDGWLKIWPNSTKALLVMSYLKFNDDKLTEAEPLARRVIEILNGTPNDPHYAESLHLLGQIYIKTERGAEGTGFLKQSCELGFTQSCTAMNDAAGNTKQNTPASSGTPTEIAVPPPTIPPPAAATKPQGQQPSP